MWYTTRYQGSMHCFYLLSEKAASWQLGLNNSQTVMARRKQLKFACSKEVLKLLFCVLFTLSEFTVIFTLYLVVGQYPKSIMKTFCGNNIG